ATGLNLAADPAIGDMGITAYSPELTVRALMRAVTALYGQTALVEYYWGKSQTRGKDTYTLRRRPGADPAAALRQRLLVPVRREARRMRDACESGKVDALPPDEQRMLRPPLDSMWLVLTALPPPLRREVVEGRGFSAPWADVPEAARVAARAVFE